MPETENSPFRLPAGNMICDIAIAPEGSELITASVVESPDVAALTFGAWILPVPLLLLRAAAACATGTGIDGLKVDGVMYAITGLAVFSCVGEGAGSAFDCRFLCVGSGGARIELQGRLGRVDRLSQNDIGQFQIDVDFEFRRRRRLNDRLVKIVRVRWFGNDRKNALRSAAPGCGRAFPHRPV